MRKRFFRKAVLAAVIAVPAVFSHPDSRALAQEEGKAIEREKEAAGAEQQELWESEEEMENILCGDMVIFIIQKREKEARFS